MRRMLVATLIAVALGSNVGCFIPIFSADPAKRTRQLIFQSENLRNFIEEWERIWLIDQPDHMTPRRVHGGVI